MKKRAVFLPACVILGALLLWELFVRASGTPPYVLPAPSATARALAADFPAIARHASVTLRETLLGLAIASLAGMALAVLMDALPALRRALYPLLVVSQTIPVIVLAPIFIIYLGFGLAPKILTVALMCFFPVAVSFADGLRGADARQVNLLRSFGASRAQVYRLVKIPAAAAPLFSGLKVAATYSVTGAVVGEWLSSNSGLGFYMLRVKNAYMLDRVFACILAVALLSLGMNGLTRLLQYIFAPYLRRKKR
jgi:ABC-type nitrate/sulfonate/bicarbonate transport system permease component